MKEEQVEFIFDGNIYSPNKKFTKIYFNSLLSDYFINLEILLDNKLDSRDVFNSSNQNIYINNKAIIDYHIDDLLFYLTEEIYNFELVEFEFDLHVLIRRFYKENSFIIDNYALENLTNLICSIERNSIKKSTNLIKGIQKQKIHEQIYNSLLTIFEERKTAIRTIVLIELLNNNGLVVDRITLLGVLNKFPYISKFGADTWIFMNDNNLKKISGNLTDIAIALLKDSKIPLHISEFIHEFSKYRKIDDRSLITNFKVSKLFVFFNCGFIGLKGIIYPKYYSDLPRVVGYNFTLLNIDRISSIYNGDLLIGFEELYSYPHIHTLYTLRKNGYL